MSLGGDFDTLLELSLRSTGPVPLASLSFSPFFLPLPKSSPFFAPFARSTTLLPVSEPSGCEVELSTGLDLFDFVLLKGFHLFDTDLDTPLGLGAGSCTLPPEVTVVNVPVCHGASADPGG
jgi:hypothetical protein